MKLLLDDTLQARHYGELLEYGHELAAVLTPTDAEEILRLAREQEQVIITRNADYDSLIAKGAPPAGVVLIAEQEDPDHEIDVLRDTLAEYRAELADGQTVSISPEGVATLHDGRAATERPDSDDKFDAFAAFSRAIHVTEEDTERARAEALGNIKLTKEGLAELHRYLHDPNAGNVWRSQIWPSEGPEREPKLPPGMVPGFVGEVMTSLRDTLNAGVDTREQFGEIVATHIAKLADQDVLFGDTENTLRALVPVACAYSGHQIDMGKIPADQWHEAMLDVPVMGIHSLRELIVEALPLEREQDKMEKEHRPPAGPFVAPNAVDKADSIHIKTYLKNILFWQTEGPRQWKEREADAERRGIKPGEIGWPGVDGSPKGETLWSPGDPSTKPPVLREPRHTKPHHVKSVESAFDPFKSPGELKTQGEKDAYIKKMHDWLKVEMPRQVAARLADAGQKEAQGLIEQDRKTTKMDDKAKQPKPLPRDLMPWEKADGGKAAPPVPARAEAARPAPPVVAKEPAKQGCKSRDLMPWEKDGKGRPLEKPATKPEAEKTKAPPPVTRGDRDRDGGR